MNGSSFRLNGVVVFGLLMLLFGAVLLLDTMGIADAGPILRFWPTLVIAWGIAKLTGFCCRRSVPFGIAFLLSGAYLQAMALSGDWRNSLDLTPVWLVLIGAWLVAHPPGRARLGGYRVGRAGSGRLSGVGGVFDASNLHPTGDHISSFAVLGSITRRVSSQAFRGGDVGSVLGAIEIDLRAARAVEGGAVLDVMAVMGGVDILVPDGWRVVSDVQTVLGSLEDKTRVPSADAPNMLRLRGVAVLGGVEIKH